MTAQPEDSIEWRCAAYAKAMRAHRAAASTVEALMWSLRKRRSAALKEPDTLQRLARFSDDQMIEVGTRLQKLKHEQPWSDQEIAELFIARNQCLVKTK